MKKCVTILLLIGMMIVGACTTTGIEEAEARKYNAKARAESAPITAQAVVIEAETNAAIAKLTALTNANKEIRAFDAQMARQEFAATVLEMQALSLAIREEAGAANRVATRLERAAEDAEPIGHNAAAAAANSWATGWILAIFGVLLFGFGAIVVIFAARFERQLAEMGGR